MSYQALRSHCGAALVELALVISALFIFLAGCFQIGKLVSELISASNTAYIVAVTGTDDTPALSMGQYTEGFSMTSREAQVTPILNRALSSPGTTAMFNLDPYNSGNNWLGRTVRVRFGGDMTFDLGLGKFSIGDVLRIGETTVGPYLLPGAAAAPVTSFQNPNNFVGCDGTSTPCSKGCGAPVPMGSVLISSCLP